MLTNDEFIKGLIGKSLEQHFLPNPKSFCSLKTITKVKKVIVDLLFSPISSLMFFKKKKEVGDLAQRKTLRLRLQKLPFQMNPLFKSGSF